MVELHLVFVFGSLLAFFGVAICVYWYLFWKQNYHNDLLITGPYSIVRHPFYAGFMLIPLGLTLALPIYEIILFSIFTLAVMVVHVPKEEEQLLKQYKKKYKDYMEKVPWRFIPYLY
jgi:protein-S-isoprenylcysteine O-methyltransferase Ste14